MCVIMDIIAKREMANATEDVFLIRRDLSSLRAQVLL